MKLTIALLAACVFALGVVACGATDGQTDVAGHAKVVAVASDTTPAHDDLQAGYDSDDGTVRRYGREPGAADAKAIAALVKRYYAAGSRGDGTAACALTVPAFAATIPYDYGQELGPATPPGAAALLRGSKTCAAVLTLLFEHAHDQLAAPVEVTGIRLKGDYGYALVDSMTLPISRIEVGRGDGVWKVDGLLGRPLP
jgi:hypothetical protein